MHFVTNKLIKVDCKILVINVYKLYLYKIVYKTLIIHVLNIYCNSLCCLFETVLAWPYQSNLNVVATSDCYGSCLQVFLTH